MAQRIYKRDYHGRFARTGQSARSKAKRNARIRAVGGAVASALVGAAVVGAARPTASGYTRVNIYDTRAGR